MRRRIRSLASSPLPSRLRHLPPWQLAVADSKLANAIKDKLSIKCVNDSGVMELMRGIRGQLEGLLTSVGEENLRAMRLGLSHSLSRYKLKFSADKVCEPCPHQEACICILYSTVVRSTRYTGYGRDIMHLLFKWQLRTPSECVTDSSSSCALSLNVVWFVQVDSWTWGLGS